MEHTYVPLAEKLRPTTLREVIGQEHLTGKGGLLAVLADSKQPTSLILWGPAGCGKTTIARILQHAWGDVAWVELSAVTAGVKDIRQVIEDARVQQRLGQRTVLFVDEIHRFNKSQQDAFLPHVESGLLTIVGATTENPSFEVNNALLSRMRVVLLQPLDEKALKKLIAKASKKMRVTIEPKAATLLAQLVGGDARSAINAVETAAQLAGKDRVVTSEAIKTVLQRTNYHFDKAGDEHYNVTSAYIKSMRGSDVEASMYYLYRLLAGGEDPLFIARRLMVFASEDIGMSAPYALTLAVAAAQAVERVGLPEAEYTLAHATIALAGSPKSRQVPEEMARAKKRVADKPNATIPLHLRNAPTKLLKELGYGKDYKWEAGHKPKDGFLPEGVA